MKRRSKVVEESKDKLDLKFRNLQQDWDTFTNNRSSKPGLLRQCSSAESTAIVKALHLLDNSPRNLMSSLQHRRRTRPSPSEQWWRVSTNDLAREEILRERRAAIESGKLKGRRRLFEREEMGSTSSGCFDHEVRSLPSSFSSYGSYDEDGDNRGSKGQVVITGGGGGCSCSGSSLSDEKMETEVVVVVGGKKAGVNVEVKRDEDCGGRGGGGGRLMTPMGWFSIALMVFTLGIIHYMRSNGGYKYEDEEVMLVPT